MPLNVEYFFRGHFTRRFHFHATFHSLLQKPSLRFRINRKLTAFRCRFHCAIWKMMRWKWAEWRWRLIKFTPKQPKKIDGSSRYATSWSWKSISFKKSWLAEVNQDTRKWTWSNSLCYHCQRRSSCIRSDRTNPFFSFRRISRLMMGV